MKLGSDKYLEEAKKRVNEDAPYKELAKNVDDSYTLILGAEPLKGVDESVVIGFTISHGEMTDIWRGEKKTSFILAAPYGVFVDILTGNLDVNRAFITRKLKIKGSLARLLKTAKATERFVDILRTIPAVFEGGYKERSITE